MTTTQIPVRLDVEALAPTVYKAVTHLDHAATRQLDDADLDHRLRELVRIRASQLNGCAYCIDMHTKDARAVGETEQRLYALPAWRETPFFTARERAALSFTENGHPALRDARPGRRLRGGGGRVLPRGGRGAARPDRDHQRLERAVGREPSVGARARLRRRGWDSNPRYRGYRYNGFRDRPIQPLSHPSGCDSAG